jgi:DNA topoisomerase-3
VLGAAANGGAAPYPPTPAMKRFADGLVRQKGVTPPPGYKTSISICRKFLSEHAPKKADKTADGEAVGKADAKPVSPAQLSYATKIAIGKGVVIPDEVKTNATALSAWIDQNRPSRRRNGRNAASKPASSIAPRSTAPKTISRKRKVAAAAASTTAQTESATDTPLRIPYGNKDIALRLGARYRPGGWYAPQGVDLAAFGERGWL